MADNNYNDNDTNGSVQHIMNSHSTNNENANTEPIIIKLLIDKKPFNFELDTGAAVSVMPFNTFNDTWPNRSLQHTKVTLRAFDHVITPLGICKVSVKLNNNIVDNLELFITKCGFTSLLGRSWLHALGISSLLFKEIHYIEDYEPKLKQLFKKFDPLFAKGLGCIKQFEAKLHLKKDSTPKFCKHRNVPFALLPAVEQELKKLQEQNILTPVKFSKWAAPIVPILKKNGTLRICADYKVGLNKCLQVDQYPLPIIDDMLTKLAGGKIFSKLDLAQAYQQVRMDKRSAEYLTINTHLGLFSVSRMPFGISSAPAIFQKLMDTILKGQNNVICYLDDILITSKDPTTHLQDLDTVFTTLQDSGIHLNLDKCEFFKSQVEYLGHIISADGIKPSHTKLEAMLAAPAPTNVDQLRSFLGLIGYYRKFVPDLSSRITHLNSLLSKKIPWNWNNQCTKEFELIKQTLTSEHVLTHYDPNKPLILATDASPYGIGAVLSHRFPDHSERPIMFASRTLSTTERNYSQLDREGLSIIFGVKKFHKFIFGRTFTLLTDHKPLTRIFHAEKEIPTLAAARLQRWSLILAAYSYEIKYKPSKEHSNADALSRLPTTASSTAPEENFENILAIEQNEDFPWTKFDIAAETLKDPTLSVILNYLKHGWPKIKNKDSTIADFDLKKEQLAIQDDCILWGLRVVIPNSLRPAVLKELHRCHLGIIKMKLLSRSICWWPKMDKDIENISKSCRQCQLHQRNPPKVTIHPWIRPTGPWVRLHTDLMGPYKNKMFLVTVDSYSKWPEIQMLNKADSKTIMYTLEDYFIRYGYPEHLISDNGTPFTSAEFEIFCKNRGILHTKSAPFHPASNGQAERFVDLAKTHLKKIENLQESQLQLCINDLLFSYRSTPHAKLKLSPAEMLLGRQLRSRLQKINPLPIISKIPFKERFTVGQKVLARSFGKYDKTRWLEAEIKRILSPVTFTVIFTDGREAKRHMNQLRPSYLTPTSPTRTSRNLAEDDSSILDYKRCTEEERTLYPQVDTPVVIPVVTPQARPATPTPLARYPARIRKPPDRLEVK